MNKKNSTTQLIYQQDKTSSAFAVIAMALDSSFEYAASLFPYKPQDEYKDTQGQLVMMGVDPDEVAQTLLRHQKKPCLIFTYESLPPSEESEQRVHLRSEELKALLHGQPAILNIPSKHLANAWHYIYWDGFQIFDPITKELGEPCTQLTHETIMNAILLFDT